MSWLLSVLLAINLWAISNIIDKNVVSKRVRSPIAPMIIQGFGNIVYASVAFLVFKAVFSWEGLVLGFALTILGLLYFKALHLEEASRVIAFYSIIPIFVAVLAYFFLGEKFGSEKYIGIILVVLGSVMISLKKKAKLTITKAVPFLLIFVALYSIYSVGMKYSVDTRGVASVFASASIGVFLGGSLLLIPYRTVLHKLKPKVILLVLTSQLFGVAGFLSLIYAIELGSITQISAIENLQPVFVLFYATILTILKPHIIKEEISKGPLLLKVIAIVTMVMGAYLVSA